MSAVVGALIASAITGFASLYVVVIREDRADSREQSRRLVDLIELIYRNLGQVDKYMRKAHEFGHVGQMTLHEQPSGLDKEFDDHLHSALRLVDEIGVTQRLHFPELTEYQTKLIRSANVLQSRLVDLFYTTYTRRGTIFNHAVDLTLEAYSRYGDELEQYRFALETRIQELTEIKPRFLALRNYRAKARTLSRTLLKRAVAKVKRLLPR